MAMGFVLRAAEITVALIWDMETLDIWIQTIEIAHLGAEIIAVSDSQMVIDIEMIWKRHIIIPYKRRLAMVLVRW